MKKNLTPVMCVACICIGCIAGGISNRSVTLGFVDCASQAGRVTLDNEATYSYVTASVGTYAPWD